ncbi:glycosyltransferase family 4 protein [Clostridium sp.]|uniref:glycosyltransferase family 4 protein n=1 Tax=Clostridium sp. TaxID=1506 RepID=UPI002FC5F9CF
MNILLISPLPPPAGGIATWTKCYMDSEMGKKNNIFIVNTAVKGKRVKEYTKRSLVEELKRTLNIISELKEQLNRNKIDIVHLNSPCGKFGVIRDYICARIIRKSNVKLVTHFRCDVSYQVKGKLKLFFFAKVVELSDLVLTLNTVSETFIYDKCSKKAITVPNFISDKYLNVLNIERNYSDKINNVLFAGYIIKSKGCAVIYELAKVFPSINFTLLGHVSDEFKRMAKPSNVHLLGEVTSSHVIDEMLKSDVFLFPSHTEGFPNVISEAMACGLPIISTPVGAIPDMLENRGGIVVPVNDLNKFIDAMNKLQNKSLRRQMSCWNKNKVQRQYTIDNVMDNIFNLYENIIS